MTDPKPDTHEAERKLRAQVESAVTGGFRSMEVSVKRLVIVLTALSEERKRAEKAEARAAWLGNAWDSAKKGLAELARGLNALRGTPTPTGIDHDHDWALWFEKWKAALDLMGRQQERAEKAEEALSEERQKRQEAEARIKELMVQRDGAFKLAEEVIDRAE